MKNPMAESNIRIINELKIFLEEVSEIKERREKYCLSNSSFVRKRILSFKILAVMILNTLKRSLSVEIQDFFEHLQCQYSCSKQAFSARRMKFNPQFFHDWNQVLVEKFYQSSHDYRRWKGKKLWAMDGSTIVLPDTEQLREKYGCSSNQHCVCGASARICVLYDVLNRISINALLHPFFIGEESVSLTCLEDQSLEDVLLLFDRGYPSFWLMYVLSKRNAHFVMRVQKNTNTTVSHFLNSCSQDVIEELTPSYKSLNRLKNMGSEIDKNTGLRIRMVKVLLDSGETEVLMTNLFDRTLYTLDDLKEVYGLRWGIETNYGHIKEELQLGQFSGIRPVCIEQDFAATVFLSNLQSLIEKQCQPHVEAVNKTRKYNYKVNKNISWASLKHRVVKLFLFKDGIDILYELQQLFQKYLEPERPGRKYSRKRKRKPNSKFYTLTNYKRAI